MDSVAIIDAGALRRRNFLGNRDIRYNLTTFMFLLLCNKRSYWLLTGYGYEKHQHHDDLAPAGDG